MKTVFCMKGNFGRRRRLSILVVTGNGKGLGGFALGKAIDNRAALRKAKNRAGQKLMHIELYNEHTVYHDFFTQFGKTKILVSKVPAGFGLVCHRAIRTICEVIGIKDIYAKIEGPTNLQHIVKAFFLGLLRQKTHKQIAEEKHLHLVEMRKEEDNFPRVVASPSVCRTSNQIKSDEIMNFKQYVMDGKVVLKKKKFPPYYTKLPSWENHLKKTQFKRNHNDVRQLMMVEHGELRSFLTDKYPEAKPFAWKKPKPEEEQQETEETA